MGSLPGVRNVVGLDWDIKGNLWFTDQGRNDLGGDSPPDELNVATPGISGENSVNYRRTCKQRLWIPTVSRLGTVEEFVN